MHSKYSRALLIPVYYHPFESVQPNDFKHSARPEDLEVAAPRVEQHGAAEDDECGRVDHLQFRRVELCDRQPMHPRIRQGVRTPARVRGRATNNQNFTILHSKKYQWEPRCAPVRVQSKNLILIKLGSKTNSDAFECPSKSFPLFHLHRNEKKSHGCGRRTRE